MEDHSKIFQQFMEQNGLHRVIAFSGGAETSIPGLSPDEDLAKQFSQTLEALQEKIIADAIQHFKGLRIAILTGGSQWGVPRIATTVAKELGFKTIGVFPLRGKKYSLGEDLLDLEICVEPLIGDSQWGDESPIFAQILDGAVVIGGGAGTLIECAHILKINEGALSYQKPVKYIVPIYGLGGVAEGLPLIWSKPEVRSASMPHERVGVGGRAAELLIEQLGLYDFYDE